MATTHDNNDYGMFNYGVEHHVRSTSRSLSVHSNSLKALCMWALTNLLWLSHEVDGGVVVVVLLKQTERKLVVDQ